jgi:hypothetical protein
MTSPQFDLSIQDEITSLFGFEKLRCNERCYSGNREAIPSQVLISQKPIILARLTES